MKKVFLIFPVAGLLFLSCAGDKKEASTTLAFTMKRVHLESKNCMTDSLGCATYDVTYPEFSSLDPQVQNSLNQYLTAGGGKKTVTSFEEAGKNFLDDFEKAKTQFPEEGAAWYYKVDANVLLATDSLISIELFNDSFTGGAHGIYTTRFVNVDARTGGLYLMDRFLKPGYQAYLTELGEEEFRAEHDLPDSVTLEDAEFTFPENRFALNENYGFRKEGIVFVFNVYEVASYVTGATEIIIPYEKLKDWMR